MKGPCEEWLAHYRRAKVLLASTVKGGQCWWKCHQHKSESSWLRRQWQPLAHTTYMPLGHQWLPEQGHLKRTAVLTFQRVTMAAAAALCPARRMARDFSLMLLSLRRRPDSYFLAAALKAAPSLRR